MPQRKQLSKLSRSRACFLHLSYFKTDTMISHRCWSYLWSFTNRTVPALLFAWVALQGGYQNLKLAQTRRERSDLKFSILTLDRNRPLDRYPMCPFHCLLSSVTIVRSSEASNTDDSGRKYHSSVQSRNLFTTKISPGSKTSMDTNQPCYSGD